RALAIDKIKSRENDKKEYAKNRCVEEMFKEEEFGILADGYIEDFEENKITEETLYNHYKKLIKESEIDIIAIGNIIEDELKEIIKKYFIIEGRSYKKIETEFYKKEKQKNKYIEEKFNITQGKLCMGYRTGIKADDKLFLPLLVGNEILGGGSASKLFNNVREKESLCYYINSFVFMFKGVIFIQSGVDFEQSKKVIEYIEKEIENIKNGNFTEEDIKNAIISLEKKYLSTVDYNTSVMDYYYTNFLANTKMDINETIKAIKKVKKDDILQAFSNIWLDTTYFMKGE
ncbi:MAG: insulinase family protein, partial [Eubacteriales bacterium]|nr:insulinase family protein [Eubacteriales bacterium]